MPAITSLTDASWPTSGTPTAGNSGFSVLSSSGTLVYSVDENGDKFISTTATNKTIVVRLDATASVFAGGATQYQTELVAYAELTGISGDATIGTPAGFMVDLDDATTRVTMTLNALNNVTTVGLYPTFSAISASAVAGNISGFIREPLPINTKITFGIFADQTAKLAGVTANGVRLGGWTSTATNHWSTNVYWTLPAIPGVRWRVYATSARPARSWSGSDHSFTPDYTNYALSTDGLTKSFPHIDTDGNQGLFWTYSGTCSIAEMASGGLNPLRREFIGGSGGATATSVLDIGTPSYNAYGDWALVTSFYCPSGTWAIALRNAANSADVLKFTVTAASNELTDKDGVPLSASDTTAPPLSTSKRHFFILNLNSSGTASWTLLNATDPPTARSAWSNAISGGWTPQALGKVVLTASNTVECDRVDMGPWFTNAICDSLSADYVTGLTPNLASTANNVAVCFPHTDMLAIPGMDYGGKRFGWPKETWLVTTSRPGYTRALWGSNVRTHMTYTKAMRLVAIDGAQYNDINGGTTAAGMMTLVGNDLTYCNSNNCELVLMRTFERPLALSGSMAVGPQIERRKYDALIKAYAQTNASNPRLYFCDLDRSHPQPLTTTDGAHPTSNVTATGVAIASTYMKANTYTSVATGVTASGGSRGGGMSIGI